MSRKGEGLSKDMHSVTIKAGTITQISWHNFIVYLVNSSQCHSILIHTWVLEEKYSTKILVLSFQRPQSMPGLLALSSVTLHHSTVCQNFFSLKMGHYTKLLPWWLRQVRDLPTVPETRAQSLGWEDSPGEGNGYPLQCSSLEDSMDRGYSPWGDKELETTEWLTLSENCSPLRPFSLFSSVAPSCPTLCDPMNRSTPGLPVHHQLSSLKPMSIESVMPSSHLILCRPLLLLPRIPPRIRAFSNESILRMRWPEYWSFSFSISPSNEHPGLISFRRDWLDLLAVSVGTSNFVGQWLSTSGYWHPYLTLCQSCNNDYHLFIIWHLLCSKLPIYFSP